VFDLPAVNLAVKIYLNLPRGPSSAAPTRRFVCNICVAELDIENDGLFSSAEFADMAKLGYIAQLGRNEL
jgi:hypothetical protein